MLTANLCLDMSQVVRFGLLNFICVFRIWKKHWSTKLEIVAKSIFYGWFCEICLPAIVSIPCHFIAFIINIDCLYKPRKWAHHTLLHIVRLTEAEFLNKNVLENYLIIQQKYTAESVGLPYRHHYSFIISTEMLTILLCFNKYIVAAIQQKNKLNCMVITWQKFFSYKELIKELNYLLISYQKYYIDWNVQTSRKIIMNSEIYLGGAIAS